MKYIQSFYQYPVTFSSIGKTIPARNAVGDMKNLAEVTEAELEKLQNREPFFRELVEKKKLRVHNRMPESYKSSAARINEANDEIARLKAELDKERAKNNAASKEPATEEAPAEETISDGATTDEAIDFDKADYKDLQKYAKDLGIDPNQKKAKLIEELKKAALETVKNDPDAEVTAEEK